MHSSANHHVALICPDYPRSRAFHHGTPGLSIIRVACRRERDCWKAS
jgi:catechol 2,3-dioxygenase-like lactoylglutathione lyase family enzyme